MFPVYPLKNIRKPKAFGGFRGGTGKEQFLEMVKIYSKFKRLLDIKTIISISLYIYLIYSFNILGKVNKIKTQKCY